MDTVTHSLNTSWTGHLGDTWTDHIVVDSRTSLEEYRHLLKDRTILSIFASVVIFLGFCWNIITIIFYSRKTKQTPTAIMIKYIAIFDLVVCLLAIIAGLAVNALFRYASTCKTLNFLFHWFVGTSVFILCAIAIDRYLKICKPHGRQFTNRSAFWTVVVMSSIVMIESTYKFVTHVVTKTNVTFKNSTVTSYHCVNSDDEHLRVVVEMFNWVDAFMTLAALLLFVLLYGTICYTLHKHNKTMFTSTGSSDKVEIPSITARKNDVNLSAIGVVSNDKEDMSSASLEHSIEGSPNYPKNAASTINLCENDHKIASVPTQNVPNVPSESTKKITKTPARKLSKTINAERQLTLMVIALTVAFCVCFSPYLVVAFYMSKETETQPWVYIALTSPAWQSVVNPFIFCIFNSQYRQFVKDIFTRCFSLIKCKCQNDC